MKHSWWLSTVRSIRCMESAKTCRREAFMTVDIHNYCSNRLQSLDAQENRSLNAIVSHQCSNHTEGVVYAACCAKRIARHISCATKDLDWVSTFEQDIPGLAPSWEASLQTPLNCASDVFQEVLHITPSPPYSLPTARS